MRYLKIIVIIKKGTRTKVAVFQDEIFDAGREQELEQQGFFAVAIKDPKPADITNFPDYFLAPEWIRWLMPTPETPEMWVAALGSSDDRYKLKKKLKASHSQRIDIRIEICPLSVHDYQIWYESLYLPEIGGKTGALIFWPKPAALPKKVTVTSSGQVSDFFRVFMYHQNGDLLGGLLWSLSHSESCLTTRAAAFESKARTKYQLAIRGMEESLLFANTHGLRWISYGTDQNLYGVDMTIGLQRFKASIGMQPVLARIGSLQLIKILNRNLSQLTSGDSETPSVLIFAIAEHNSANTVAAYQHLPPRKHRGNLDLLWNLDTRLTPLRFLADPERIPINVPKGMVLRDIFL